MRDTHRSFLVRLDAEGPAGETRWRGVVELVGTEERRAVAGVADVADAIARWLEPATSPPGQRRSYQAGERIETAEERAGDGPEEEGKIS